MRTHRLRHFCHICGKMHEEDIEINPAPEMKQYEFECTSCGQVTHLMLTACPECDDAFQYFISDLDFPQEITNLASTYVKLIRAIKTSLEGYVEEFDVPLPKKWSVKLKCPCGSDYHAEIPLH